MTLLLLSITACDRTKINQAASSTQSPTPQDVKSTPVGQSKKIKVVATFLPIYLFTKAVAGEAADVEILIPPGTDVHEYQATPGNVRAIASAKVLVKNGLGLEQFLADTVKNAKNSQLMEIDTSKGIQAVNEISPTEKITDGEKDHDHDHDHTHTSGNPHIWLDPVLAKQQIINIRDGLIKADPENKSTYEVNAAAYIQELEKLDQEFKQTLKPTRNCTFITFHDAFPYLAKRYNLKQVAVVAIPEDQLSPADVQKTVNVVKKYQVKALFSEPGVDNKLLASLAQDLKLPLQTLDSLEAGQTEPKYYFQVMKANLQTVANGCK